MSQISLADVAKGVHDLTEAVADWRANTVDRETVERIAEDVMQRSQRAARIGDGYTPPDVAGEFDYTGGRAQLDQRNRAHDIHARPAREVAPLIRRGEADVRDFHAAADELLILATLLGVDPRETNFYEEQFRPALAAVDTQTVAEGKEYVPTLLSASLIERVQLELLVARLFPSVKMDSPVFELPGLAVARQRGGRHAEQTADTGQTAIKKITPATRKVTLTAVKFAAEVLLSTEFDEDSLVPALPWLKAEIVDYLSADVEDCIVNGDTTGSHQDSDVTASDDSRRNWNGLRKSLLAAAKTDAANATLSVAMLRQNRKLMGRYGARADQLAHVISIANYIQLLSDSAVMTLEKYGPNATVLAGELGKVDGAPVIVSEMVRQDLNATGVHDGVTTNRSLALTVNTRGFVVGERRQMQVQLLRELWSEFDMLGIIATTRKAFSPRFPTASEKIVAAHYNLATT